MSFANVAVQNVSSFLYPLNTGVSDEAETLQKQLGSAISHLFQNATLGDPLRESLSVLNEIIQEASEFNWDGYGAYPVDKLGQYKAIRFLESLPKDLPIPDIGVDSDGDVSFHWYSETDNVFSVSVSGTGELTYAGIFGKSKIHGTEYYRDEIPKIILLNLQRLWNKELNY